MRKRENPPTKQSKQQDARACVQILLYCCPLKFPVELEFRSMKGLYGKAIFDVKKSKYRICLEKRISYAMLVETLMHEWAHCMALDRHQGVKHNRVWGTCYARCYRALVED